MESEYIENTSVNKTSKCLILDSYKDIQMSSSILSISSSLTSPIDSGVQLLDSESDITSLMSMSGAGNDLDSDVKNTEVEDKLTTQNKDFLAPNNVHSIMTKSDIANQNITIPFDYGVYSSSAPNMDYKIKYEENQEKSKIDLELSANVDIKPDTNEKAQENQMHVSVSEEVNESLKIEPSETQTQDEECAVEEQIVYRRQRKKKSSKSDIPKKRVSFHEDILNSTKIDDIHINLGFITHQPDISMSFFNWDSIRKPDVIKGRYSWAAEGDTPYYERNRNEREVKSEIYMNSRYSSTSSSSTGSVDSSSCNSLCENEHTSADGASKPCQKLPRSSCLKKRSSAKRIDTHIVQENLGDSLKQKKSESNLLDSKLFGSIKNILNFSTSIPLAERGVPEGQEDVETSTQNSSTPKRRSFSLSNENLLKVIETPKKIGNLNIEFSKNNLKLAPSEGFYPINMNVPANVVLCDSNVYEHTGISYSYEYDKFKKSLENQNNQKPKSSSVYQMLLKDLNFFKKKEKEKSVNDLKNLVDIAPTISCDSSENDTIFDITETNSKHLTSPKHKVNKMNHYSVQNFKAYDTDSQKILNLKPSTSKSSLINRFLRNVTMKKILDVKLQKKQKILTNKRMSLYMKDVEPDEEICNKLDDELEDEIAAGLQRKPSIKEELHYNSVFRLKREVFRDSQEILVNLYKVHSAYSSKGSAKPLLVFLTNATLYITGFKPDQTFYNLFVLPYIELNTILIGPNGHTIHFANGDREMQYIVTTGCSDITNSLVGQLELIIRKNNNINNNNNNNNTLPAIRHLTMQEMAQLKFAVCTETTVNKEEEYFHYSIVNIQEANGDVDSTPLGPTKKGPLMFKTANDIRWETGYFILKGGVLYILSSPSNRLPLRAFSLVNGACLGAHRTPYCHRPHTFELLVNSMVLQLAAPDEYVASDWLQVLIQTASGLYNNETNDIQTCTLLLTSQHILTMRETFPNGNPNTNYKSQALSCANISDLTAFRIPLAEQSWCILEFACREVHETSGDLIIYFTTNAELERFISTLELLWAYNNINGDSFPMNTIPDYETINKKCDEVYHTLKDAWNSVNLLVENGY